MHAYACQNWAAAARFTMLEVVGDRALAASAYRDAASHFEHADVDALYRLPRDRRALEAAIEARLQARVCYLAALAKHDLCLAHIEQAEQLARELGDDKRALAVYHLSRWCVELHRAGSQIAVFARESALTKAEALGNVAHIAIAGYVLGQAHYAAGDYRKAVAAFVASARRLTGELAMIRLGTTGTAAAMCAALQAAARAQLGEFDDPLACLARANAIARQTDRPYDIISHGYAEGITNSQQGKLEATIASFERALVTCRAADIETFATTLAGQLGQAYIAAGRVDDALSSARARAGRRALTLQNGPQIAMLKRQLGYGALCQNDLARAARLSAEAASVAASGGYRMIHASALHLQSMVHLRQSQRPARRNSSGGTGDRDCPVLGARPALARMSVTRNQLAEVRNSDRGRDKCDVKSARSCAPRHACVRGGQCPACAVPAVAGYGVSGHGTPLIGGATSFVAVTNRLQGG